ncbi:MAG TPA: serine hydrolase domain-containing protein [Roseiarcus sp.]|jgi:CubicO group peptidase (beta-lactamase class C family)
MTTTLSRTFAGLPTAEPEEIGLSRAGLKRLTAVMEREIAAGRAPGTAMLIARNGKVGYAQTLGALEPGGPAMPSDAIFRIYSMTKPIVSVAAMMLVEEGRMFLAEPLSKYIPAFAETKVGVENDAGLDLVPLKRPITIQDLMRHTSGLTYGFTGASPVQKLVATSRIGDQEGTLREQTEALAALPLKHQPNEVWEYSLSTDVLGRVIEVIEGARLGEVLSARIFEPLGMDDTAFFIPSAKLGREAKPMSPDVYANAGRNPDAATAPPRFESGGGGLYSTIGDYARFLAMLSGGGKLDGERILGPRTITYMASDHLGAHIDRSDPLLTPGHGFGLGFGVRLQNGVVATTGSVGDYFWGGWAATNFRISPQDSLFAIFMAQAPDYSDHFFWLFRNLYNAAIR